MTCLNYEYKYIKVCIYIAKGFILISYVRGIIPTFTITLSIAIYHFQHIIIFLDRLSQNQNKNDLFQWCATRSQSRCHSKSSQEHRRCHFLRHFLLFLEFLGVHRVFFMFSREQVQKPSTVTRKLYILPCVLPILIFDLLLNFL